MTTENDDKLRKMATRVCLKVAEIAFPSQNIPYYQEGEVSQFGGGYQQGTWRYPSIGTQKDYNGWYPMTLQGERPTMDTSFHTEPYASSDVSGAAPWGEQYSRPRGGGVIADPDIEQATDPAGCGPDCEQVQRFLLQIGKPPVEEGDQESEFRYDRANYPIMR